MRIMLVRGIFLAGANCLKLPSHIPTFAPQHVLILNFEGPNGSFAVHAQALPVVSKNERMDPYCIGFRAYALGWILISSPCLLRNSIVFCPLLHSLLTRVERHDPNIAQTHPNKKLSHEP